MNRISLVYSPERDLEKTETRSERQVLKVKAIRRYETVANHLWLEEELQTEQKDNAVDAGQRAKDNLQRDIR